RRGTFGAETKRSGRIVRRTVFGRLTVDASTTKIVTHGNRAKGPMFQRSSLALASVSACACLLITLAVLRAPAQTPPTGTATRFPDAHEAPSKGWTGPVFQLRQDYPRVQPPPEDYPWTKYDFRDKAQWKDYMRAVLLYCYDGNLEVDWVVQRNRKR